MENDFIRLIVTTQIGPRIICFQTVGGENVFHEFPEQQGLTGGDEWRNYGGHRLWHSPQIGFRPNQPDNVPVQWSVQGNRVILEAPVEEKTLIQKKLEILFEPDAPKVTIRHFLRNCGLWPIELAPWALSVMRPEGLEVLPVPREDTFYMPNYAVSFWPWTRPNDPRFTWGEHYFLLRHDPSIENWFKIGYRNTEGWGAYFTGNCMFVKFAPEQDGKQYPDYGSTFETYSDQFFTELESLGPLSTVNPDSEVLHEETWYLFDGIARPEDEEDIATRIEPLICTLQKK